MWDIATSMWIIVTSVLAIELYMWTVSGAVWAAVSSVCVVIGTL